MIAEIDALDILPRGKELAYRGLAIVEANYGPNSPDPHFYHGVPHSLHTAIAAYHIGLAEEVDQRTLANLVGAGGFHDAVHGLGHGPDEIKSAELAVAAMKKMGAFSTKDYYDVKEMILGTTVTEVDGHFSQTAATPNAQILADADLHATCSRLPIFWGASTNYFEELNPGEPHDGEAMYEFLSKTIDILKYHRFYTSSAERLYPYREQNLAHALKVQAGIGKTLGLKPELLEIPQN